jgi:NADP-dependent 3-hydroxy acid dehydrogenase YdfG
MRIYPRGWAGRTVAVVGATGGVGEGVAAAFVRAGARVVAVSRSTERLAALTDRLRQAGDGVVEPLVVDVLVATPGAITRTVVERFGQLDAVVVSVGNPVGPRNPDVLALEDTDFLAMVRDNELAGLRALRAFVPATKREGVVVHLIGFSSEVPFPQNPLMGSTNAGVRSLVTSLAVQRADTGPDVYALIIGVVRTRARRAAGIDNPRWLEGAQIGEFAMGLAARRPAESVHYMLDPGTASVSRR